jgi:hypothetical protein
MHSKPSFEASDDDKKRFWVEPSVVFNQIFEPNKIEEVQSEGIDIEMGGVDRGEEEESVGMIMLTRLMAGTGIE